MGLLDALSNFASTDEGMGLAQGLLSARGSAGMAAGMAGMQQAREQAQLRQMRALQAQQLQMSLDQSRREAEKTQKIDALSTQFMRSPEMANAMSMGPNESGAAVPKVQPGFDFGGYAQALAGIDPMKSIAVQQAIAKDSQFNKIDPKDFTPESVAKFSMTRNYGDLKPREKLHFADTGGKIQALGEYSGLPVNAIEKTGNPFTDLVVADGRGGVVPNAPLVGVKKDIAAAGKPVSNINVNTEKSFLGEVANGVGKQVTDSLSGAKSAANALQTIGNLNTALNSGKILTGPLTQPSKLLLQLGTQLGLSGKDGNETLANTSKAIQSLAQLEMDAAQGMKGQGNVTENERVLIKRAAAGDINMSMPELKALSGALDKSARFRINQHNKNVQPLMSNPNAASLAPFMTVEEPASNGFKIIGVQ